MFEKPGDLDENSTWYKFVDPQMKALDQAVKARRAAEHAAFAATAPSPTATALERRVNDLEDRLMAMALYSRTILQLLLDNGTISGEAFAKRLNEIDMLDGKLDGR